jgi:hypothetical protein
VVRQLLYCGETGAYGTAGGGSDFSHTATWEKNLESGMQLLVLSAGWELSAEELAFGLLDHLLEGEELPAVPEAGELDPDEMARVSGIYRSDAGAIVTVEEVPGGMRLEGEGFADPDADLPWLTFRPGVDGDFVSFTLSEMPIADRVTFGEEDTMTIYMEERSVEYRREA